MKGESNSLMTDGASSLMRGGASSPMLTLLGPGLKLQQPANGQTRVSEGQDQLSMALGYHMAYSGSPDHALVHSHLHGLFFW